MPLVKTSQTMIPFIKYTPLLIDLSNKHSSVFLPGKKNLSIDEAMIGYERRLQFQQYMPAKRTKVGIKVWEVCESDTGYCVNFHIDQPHELEHDVAWSLTEPFQHHHQHLFVFSFLQWFWLNILPM